MRLRVHVYEVYNGIAKAGGLTHLGCWIHARRPLIKAEEAIPKAARSPDQLATRFVRLIGKLYRAESLARDWAPARRLRLRSRYSAAVVRESERLLLTHLHAVAPSSLLGGSCQGQRYELEGRAWRGSLRLPSQAAPLVHEVGVQTVSHCDAGNGGMRLRAFGEDLRLERGAMTPP